MAEVACPDCGGVAQSMAFNRCFCPSCRKVTQTASGREQATKMWADKRTRDIVANLKPQQQPPPEAPDDPSP